MIGAIALKLASGLFLRPARALFGWLVADWRHVPLFLLALHAAAHIFLIDPDLRSDLVEARAAHRAERAAHDQTIADFARASRAAEARQAVNLARVRNEQAAITERIADDYQTRLDDLRGRAADLAERLRPTAPAIGAGAPGAAHLPGSRPTARGAAEAPGDPGLSGAGCACGPLSLEERLIASEQALQLDALIEWTLEQVALSTSPEPEPAP